MLGSFYTGSMYGGTSVWLWLDKVLDVNGMAASVAIGSVPLTGGRSLSVADHTVVTFRAVKLTLMEGCKCQ